MGIPYHPGFKAPFDGMATLIISCQGQSQTNPVKVQDYGNSALGPMWRFAGEPFATKNNDQLRCLLRNSTEALRKYCKTNGAACCQKVFLLLHYNAMPHTLLK
ncbi:hypothetical protein TNCV_2831771 [Trichonephila clavipes]|nr:hypothetical protein TNCV_2831771 [Trichonephila clavipes]